MWQKTNLFQPCNLPNKNGLSLYGSSSLGHFKMFHRIDQVQNIFIFSQGVPKIQSCESSALSKQAAFDLNAVHKFQSINDEL